MEGTLKAEGYKKRGSDDSKAKMDYIVVFDDAKEGKFAHSETVIKNDKGNVFVTGKGGNQPITTKSIDEAWDKPKEKRYYEKTKQDLKMNEKDITKFKEDLEKALKLQ